MTVVIVVVLCFVFTVVASYFAAMAQKNTEYCEKRCNELQTFTESKVKDLEDELKRVNRELEINERSHGELAIEIKEISKLKKTDELRAEVLHTGGGKNGRIHREEQQKR